MGGGSWDPGVYTAVTTSRVNSGTSFGYSTSTRASVPASSWTAHADLDPKTVAGPASPVAGKNIRESRDNVDHPLSVPIVVGFDQTGSMGVVPQELQKKLATLFGVLLRKGYVEDPQIAVAAYGDVVNHERVPLQFSQFESDNRIDESLDNIFLEGNGGGNMGETGQLVWYFAGRHTVTDSWEKRGKKGYLFTIGDEVMLPVPRRNVEDLVGGLGVPVEFEGDLTAKAALDIASEQWEVYHLIINNATATMQQSIKFYTDLLGDHAIVLEDHNAVAETIAMIIGMAEGTVDLDDAVDDLKALGADAGSIASASKAVAKLSGSTGKKFGDVVKADSVDGLDADDDDVARV